MLTRVTSVASSLQFGLVAAALGVAAQAQEAPAHPGTAGIEEIVVTGSLLHRESATGSQLVTTLDAADIEKAGAGNAVQALAAVAQNQPTVTSAVSIGAATGFASFANLRSLGSSNTLVLFNGKRLVNNPYQTLGVDLNTIPLNLIERIEVLSDGASSIYGSDAIAGVINFMTVRERTGLSLSVSGFRPEHPEAERVSASISGGIGSLAEQGWNVFGGVTWNDKERLGLAARDFSDSTYIPEFGVNRLQNTTFPANWSQGATLGTINPSSPGCNPPATVFAGGNFGARSCSFDFAVLTDAFPEQTDQSLLLHGSLKLGQQLATLEYLRGETDLVSRISPTAATGLTMTPANPYFPGNGITPAVAGLNPAANITVNWRLVPLGRATVNPVTTTDRAVLQLEGEIATWRYELSALRSTSTVELNFVSGFVDSNRLRDGLTGTNGSPFLNPFGEQSAAGAQYLEDIVLHGQMQRARSTLNYFGLQASRDLFGLPAGAVQLALAADYKDETTRFRNDPSATLALGSGLETARDIDGNRQSYSVTAETIIPLLPMLELNASVRYDDYSDFGDTVNPKFMLTFEPVAWLALHASYNRGFRAPTLHNVFAPVSLQSSRNRRPDPVLCPGGVVNTAAGGIAARDCGGQPYRIRTGGNPDLDPEKSEAYAAGLRLQQSDAFSVGLDYWNYHLTDTIAVLSESAIFADLDKYGNLVVRCSQAEPELASLIPNCIDGLGGDPIGYVAQENDNLGDTKTSGIDFTAQWIIVDAPWGRLRFDYRGTYVLDFDFQRERGGEFFSRAGQYSDGFPVIDYSHYSALAWDHRPWSLQVSNRFMAGYDDCNAQCNIPTEFHGSVDAYSLWDLAATFNGPGNATIIARVTNVLDTDPVFSNKTSGLATGYDERITDPVGRAYSLSLAYSF